MTLCTSILQLQEKKKNNRTTVILFLCFIRYDMSSPGPRLLVITYRGDSKSQSYLIHLCTWTFVFSSNQPTTLRQLQFTSLSPTHSDTATMSKFYVNPSNHPIPRPTLKHPSTAPRLDSNNSNTLPPHLPSISQIKSLGPQTLLLQQLLHLFRL